MKTVRILVAFIALYLENLMMYNLSRRKLNCESTRKIPIPGEYLCLPGVGGGVSEAMQFSAI